MSIKAATTDLALKVENFFGEVLVTASELQNPTMSVVVKFLSRALYEFNVDIDSLKISQLGQSTCSMYPETYSDSVFYINMYQVIKSIFEKSKMNVDFSLEDILQPRPGRNLRFMNAVMDFLNFADERVSDLSPIYEDIKRRKREHEKMEERNQMLIEGISELMKKKDAIQARKDELKKIIENDTKKWDERKAMNDALGKQREASVNVLKEKEKRMGDLVKIFKDKTEERQKISSKIVDCPESIISDIEKQRRKREECNAELQDLGDKIKEIKDQNRELCNLMENLSFKNKKLQTLKPFCISINELEQSLKEGTEKLENIKTMYSDLEKKYALAEKKKTTHIELKKQATEQYEMQKKTISETLNKRKSNINAETMKKLDESNLVEQINSEISTYQIELNKMYEEYDKLMHLLNDKYVEVNANISKLKQVSSSRKG